jgi:hypothetical protein
MEIVQGYTAQEKLDAILRELSYRHRVYARRVSEGKMHAELGRKQIAIFEAIRDDYKALVEKERLI